MIKLSEKGVLKALIGQKLGLLHQLSNLWIQKKSSWRKCCWKNVANRFAQSKPSICKNAVSEKYNKMKHSKSRYSCNDISSNLILFIQKCTKYCTYSKSYQEKKWIFHLKDNGINEASFNDRIKGLTNPQEKIYSLYFLMECLIYALGVCPNDLLVWEHSQWFYSYIHEMYSYLYHPLRKFPNRL